MKKEYKHMTATIKEKYRDGHKWGNRTVSKTATTRAVKLYEDERKRKREKGGK